MRTKCNISALLGSFSEEHHCDDGGDLNMNRVLDSMLMTNFLRVINIITKKVLCDSCSFSVLQKLYICIL